MIEPIRADGKERALCTCDFCRKETAIAAAHGHNKPGQTRGGLAKLTLQSEGQVVTKLSAQGWTNIRGKLRCPECEAKRKASTDKEKPMENVTPIRTPTREEKREIIAMLDMAYDIAAGRYKGGDTDKTIAETIGGGVMPGWVAEIREDLYGPDGGNDEIEKVVADMIAWREDMAKMAAEMHDTITDATKALRDFNEGRGKADEFLKRIEAIKAAVGPKAARA